MTTKKPKRCGAVKKFTLEQVRYWILGRTMLDGTGKKSVRFKKYNRTIKFLGKYLSDREDGIAAVTERYNGNRRTRK